MTDDFWAEATFQAALTAFGPALYNHASRTRVALYSRISHVYKVWNEKYGTLTPEQEEYGDQVIAAVIRGAVRDAKGDAKLTRQYVMHRIGACIHNERVVAGMRRRGQYVDPSEILEALA